MKKIGILIAGAVFAYLVKVLLDFFDASKNVPVIKKYSDCEYLGKDIIGTEDIYSKLWMSISIFEYQYSIIMDEKYNGILNDLIVIEDNRFFITKYVPYTDPQEERHQITPLNLLKNYFNRQVNKELHIMWIVNLKNIIKQQNLIALNYLILL